MAILLWLTSCWATVMAQGLTRSGLDPQRFDSVMDGTRTALYTLVNRQGMEACVTNYGARLVSLVVDGKVNGRFFPCLGLGEVSAEIACGKHQWKY